MALRAELGALRVTTEWEGEGERRRTRPGALALVVVLLVVGAAVGVRQAGGEGSSLTVGATEGPPAATPGPAPTPSAAPSPSTASEEPIEQRAVVARLPAAPIGARAATTEVWTGSELLVWGGYRVEGRPGERVTAPYADGAAYDPADRRWRVLAAAPLSGRLDPEAVWTGTEMVVLGGLAPVSGGGGAGTPLRDAAAYDPAADRWRPLPAVPAEAGAVVGPGVWTGREVVVSVTAPSQAPAWRAYDPSADVWRDLPPAPEGLVGVTRTVWTGDALVAVGRGAGVNLALRLDPAAATWTVLAAPPIVTGPLVWTGDRLRVAGDARDLGTGATRRATFSLEPGPDAGWELEEPPPARLPLEDVTGSAWTGTGWLLVAAGESAVQDGSGAWRRLPGLDEPRRAAAAAWTGTQLLVWGGVDGDNQVVASGVAVALTG